MEETAFETKHNQVSSFPFTERIRGSCSVENILIFLAFQHETRIIFKEVHDGGTIHHQTVTDTKLAKEDLRHKASDSVWVQSSNW